MRLAIVGLTCSILMAISCLDAPESTRLSYDEQKLADSIFYLVKNDYIAELDSVCTERSKREFDSMVDSIYQIRVQEIKNITAQ